MSAAGPTDDLIFFVNGKKVVEQNADPEEMLLPYLRRTCRLTGTKYGCGVGGCGACTVMISIYDPASKKIRHYSAVACLIPICWLYATAVTTVEGIGSTKTRLHPVQERIAKSNGSQCGFCTPGMVMSMYTLLRNHPDPNMEQIIDALGGNLCRCTGYRPIIDGCITFFSGHCKKKDGTGCCLDAVGGDFPVLGGDDKTCKKIRIEEPFEPYDPTQEIIFPPELMIMVRDQPKKKLFFKGERVTWISPANLAELLDLRVQYPNAPLVVGNTTIGVQTKTDGVLYPVLLTPVGIPELTVVSFSNTGLTLGAACNLTQMKDVLTQAMAAQPKEKTKTFQALLKQLKTLGGEQIRNMASLGGHIVTRSSTSDLNPILAAGKAVLNLSSKAGASRQIPLDESFFAAASPLKPGEVLVSVVIPYTKKEENVSAFRQSMRQKNSSAFVNAGMWVLFNTGTDVIADFNIFYGGMGQAVVSAKKACQKLIEKRWDDQMLTEACKNIVAEVLLPGSAPGGMVEFRRTLTISFLLKFYLETLLALKKMNVVTSKEIPPAYLSALDPLTWSEPQSVEIYQEVAKDQPIQDPVGRPVPHLSAAKQATGEADYTDDMPVVDNELFLAFATSTRAHATIKIDVAEALKMPGVVDILTAKDVPGVNLVADGDEVFASEEVICVGQLVAAVVADTEANAKRAAAKVNITYQDMQPVILTIQDAIKNSSYFQPERKLHYGNVDVAFKTCDQILEGELYTGGQEQFYLETNSILVIPKEDKEMDVFLSTQAPSQAQQMVAKVLGVACNRVTCHTRRAGGGFGGKLTKPAPLASAAAVAANKTGRPVRCVLERDVDMLMTAGRHPFYAKYKVGFMNDGSIMAVDLQHYSNAGCTPDESILVIDIALVKMDNGYRFPNLRVVGRACKTNLPSNTGFRGFGFPQTGVVTETVVDAVAVKCGLAPEKVREKNMHKGTSSETHYKQKFDATNLTRCWSQCMEKSSYKGRRKAIEEFNKKNYYKKKGIAIIPLKFSVGFIDGAFHQAGALVHIYQDGSVLVTHGGVEMGQGLHTKVSQIASRVLNIPISKIYICETATNTVANTIPSGGSIGTDIYGLAVKTACETILERIKPVQSANPSGKWEDWIMAAFFSKICLSATAFFNGYATGMNWETGEGHATPYYVFGAGCSEVEIDCLTGASKLIRSDIVMDIGKSINPGIDVGQIEGAFMQGVGLYTTEELKYSPGGSLYTRGPDQYKIPTIVEIPEQFFVYLLSSSENPYTIYSSKGVGEPSLFLGCTVYFAIKDAIDAARKERKLSNATIPRTPLSPERIRMACSDNLTDMIPKDPPGSFTPWAINV